MIREALTPEEELKALDDMERRIEQGKLILDQNMGDWAELVEKRTFGVYSGKEIDTLLAIVAELAKGDYEAATKIMEEKECLYDQGYWLVSPLIKKYYSKGQDFLDYLKENDKVIE